MCIRDPGWKKLRSVMVKNLIRDKHPGSATLVGKPAMFLGLPDPDPVFRIRIHFFRIRIQRLRLETNTDPDPIQIQAFNDQKLKKNNS